MLVPFEEIITFRQFIRDVGSVVRVEHPEDVSRITRKALKRAYDFLRGYYSCLAKELALPVKKNELQNFLIRESIPFLLKIL